MHWSVLVLLVCAAAVVLFGQLSPRNEAWPVYARPVLTEPERVLYARLRDAFPQLLVLPQVQICRFVEVKKVGNRRAVLNRYDRLSADFVVCRAEAVPVAVIELDDTSHDRPASRARDAKKAAVLAAAGVRLLRWHVRSMPDVAAIRQEFEELIGGVQQSSNRGNPCVIGS
jgi:very-short-patch-repair endonuclease